MTRIMTILSWENPLLSYTPVSTLYMEMLNRLSDRNQIRDISLTKFLGEKNCIYSTIQQFPLEAIIVESPSRHRHSGVDLIEGHEAGKARSGARPCFASLSLS